jgi:K(+)-stimulated pyrophosphate-energized sodium pump
LTTIISSDEAIKVALRGGAFSGMLIVTLSLFGVGSMFRLAHRLFPNVNLSCLSNVIVGYGFGAFFIALFAQFGGGIYTKAVDVGSDLFGKVNNDIPEDDPHNPAVGANLFESSAAENIGAIVIGGTIASQHQFIGLSLAGYILFPITVPSFVCYHP